MKCSSLAVLVLVLVAYSKSDDAMFRKMLENVEPCIKETNVDRSLVVKLQDEVFTDDPKFKCFLKCLYVKAGTMTENGEWVLEELRKTLDPGKDVTIVDKCVVQKGTDACDTAFLVAKCTETS